MAPCPRNRTIPGSRYGSNRELGVGSDLQNTGALGFPSARTWFPGRAHRAACMYPTLGNTVVTGAGLWYIMDTARVLLREAIM